MSATGSERPRPGDSGFTLLELMVVLVIAALMVSLVIPRIPAVLPGAQLKSFTRQSAALLREMRSEAVSQSRNRPLALDIETRTYRSGDKVLAHWPDGISVQLQQGEIPDFMQSPFAQEESGLLIFFPDGSSNGGELTLTGSSHGYVVAVDALSGRVQIDDQ